MTGGVKKRFYNYGGLTNSNRKRDTSTVNPNVRFKRITRMDCNHILASRTIHFQSRLQDNDFRNGNNDNRINY